MVLPPNMTIHSFEYFPWDIIFSIIPPPLNFYPSLQKTFLHVTTNNFILHYLPDFS